MRLTLRFLFPLMGALVGCQAGSPASGPDMQVEKVCTLTRCELEQRECEVEIAVFCHDCEARCARYGTCLDCIDLCGRYDCSGCSETGCAEAEYEVLMPDPEPAVGEACREYFAHLRECGATFEGDPCNTYERTERRSVTAAYRCLTQLPCGADADAACDLPEPQGLANELCAALADICGSPVCPQEVYDWIEREDGWLRPDVRDALRSCYDEPSCKEAAECTDAWLGALGAFGH